MVIHLFKCTVTIACYSLSLLTYLYSQILLLVISFRQGEKTVTLAHYQILVIRLMSHFKKIHCVYRRYVLPPYSPLPSPLGNRFLLRAPPSTSSTHSDSIVSPSLPLPLLLVYSTRSVILSCHSVTSILQTRYDYTWIIYM